MSHLGFEVIGGCVLLPPGEVRRQDPQCAPAQPGLALEPLQVLVQPRGHHHIRPLPRAALQLVPLTPTNRWIDFLITFEINGLTCPLEL